MAASLGKICTTMVRRLTSREVLTNYAVGTLGRVRTHNPTCLITVAARPM